MVKDYVKSSVITFVSTFAIAVVPFLGDASWSKSALLGLLLVGVRAGVKGLFEYLATVKV